MKKFWFLSLLAFVIAAALTGCDTVAAPDPTPIPGAPVYPAFLPVYARIADVFPGGLGMAKTGPQDMGTFVRQVFEKGVMVYDPAAHKVALQPVGYQQSQKETPVELAQGPGWVQVQGYWVPPAVAKIYNALGTEIFGAPLSNYRYNSAQQRYEIYFENLGIYMLPDDPLEQVYLLPYGNWMLANESFPEGKDNTPMPKAIIQNATDAFDALASRTDEAFLGEELAPLTTSPDGRIIRVYANAVMVWDAETNQADWMNLPEIMGIQPGGLVDDLQNEKLFFVPIQGNKGHNIPNKFWEDFLALYGGLDTAGKPITELIYKEGSGGQVMQQCYEHICLEFDYNTKKVAPTPLGAEYYRKYGGEQHPQNASPPLSLVKIETRLAHASISPTEPQQVWSRIQVDGKPAADISPVLILHLPEGQVEFSFPPTNAQGETSLTLPPMTENNGVKVLYDVCLVLDDGSKPCATGQFFILPQMP